jgi:hypothetical protein
MVGGITTLPLRAGIGYTRFVLRIAGDAAGCAAKISAKAVVTATEAVGRAAGRASDEAAWGRPAPPLDTPPPPPPAREDARSAPARQRPRTAPARQRPRTAPARQRPRTPPAREDARPSLSEPTPASVADRRPVPDRAPSAFDGPFEVPRPPETLPESATPAEPPAASQQPPAHVSEQPELVREVADPGAEDGAGASVAIAEPWPGYRQMNAKQVIERVADATPAELAAIELYESSNRDRQTVRAAVQRSLKAKTGRGSPD